MNEEKNEVLARLRRRALNSEKQKEKEAEEAERVLQEEFIAGEGFFMSKKTYGSLSWHFK